MKHRNRRFLSILLSLVLILGLLTGMSLTAYATTVTRTDVYDLLDDMYDLIDQKDQEGNMQAADALYQAFRALYYALSNAEGSVTPEVEAAYNSALAVYQQYGGGGHTHSWGYQASGASVTATCTTGNCDYKTNGVTLTISAPANLECDGNAKAAAISGEIPSGSGLPDPSNITYNPGGSTAPSTPGTYTASFTWGGATASVSFTLAAPQPTTYTVNLSGGGNTTYSGGDMSQTVTQGQAMTTVIFTPNNGYHFEAYAGASQNGVTAVLSNGVITVSGTPTGNVGITIPAAAAIPAPTTYTVNLSGGGNTTYSGGDMSQTVTQGQAMTTVIFTPNNGYHFEAYAGASQNGVTAVLSNGVITVSGTPTGNVGITIPAAAAIPAPTTYTVTYVANNDSGETRVYTPNIGEPHNVEGQLFAAPQGKVFDNWLGDDGQIYLPGSQISTTRTLTAQWNDEQGGGNGDIVFIGGFSGNGGGDDWGGYVAPQRAYRVSFAPMQGGSAAFVLSTGESGGQMNVYPHSTIRVQAYPDSGYEVASIIWSLIDGSASYDITQAQTFVMPAMDVVVSVTFKPVG